MDKLTRCCKECTERAIGCHAECIKYAEWQKAKAEEKDYIHKQRLGDDLLKAYYGEKKKRKRK